MLIRGMDSDTWDENSPRSREKNMRLSSLELKRALVGLGVAIVVFLYGVPLSDVYAESRHSITLPTVLSSKDADLYRHMFRLQREKKWDEAEALLSRLDDDLLKGRILAQRYLSSYDDPDVQKLTAWLKAYNDCPEAETLYNLAKGVIGEAIRDIPSPSVGEDLPARGIAIRDGGANWGGGGYHSTQKAPVSSKSPVKKAASGKKTTAKKTTGGSVKAGKIAKPSSPAKKISFTGSLMPVFDASDIVEIAAAKKTKAVRGKSASRGGNTSSAFYAALRKDEPDRAETLLGARLGTAGSLSSEQSEMMIALGAYYLTHGRTGDAARVAEQTIAQASSPPPNAYWIAGLAKWREGEPESASRYFEAIARGDAASSWLTSAAAYWAARSDLVARRPERVNGWLETAAAYPRSFYGILARRALARSGDHAWEGSVLAGLDVELLSSSLATRRALALIQIGEKEHAAAELTLMFPKAGIEMARSIQALAYASEMRDLAQRFGAALMSREDSSVDMSHYPLPNWQPVEGWTLDKALVYAFVRQESAFNVTARSSVGAAGVMQLMPATARSVAGEKVDRKTLHDPEANIDLGQKYLARLLDDTIVDGNLFYLAAAYNGGPGSVQRWKTNGIEDPLYFIETIPMRETRIFVQRVMTNLWIYRDRFGQAAPSLDAVVAGEWPEYVSQDNAR